MAKKKCKKYAIFDNSVDFKDRFKVPNFNKLRKFRKKSTALKYASKKYKDRVYCVSE